LLAKSSFLAVKGKLGHELSSIRKGDQKGRANGQGGRLQPKYLAK
jgi:hypothetical protein